MNEEMIRNQIDECLMYFRKCRNRYKIFNKLFIPFLILTICFIAFIVFVYVMLYLKSIDLMMNLYTAEQAINYLSRKYRELIIIYSSIQFLTIFTLTGTIVFGTFSILNKKAYLRNENRVYTLKKDLKYLQEKSHS